MNKLEKLAAEFANGGLQDVEVSLQRLSIIKKDPSAKGINESEEQAILEAGLKRLRKGLHALLHSE